jgi:hypothetical protein
MTYLRLGHILGFLDSSYAKTGNYDDNTFTGPAAVAFNRGRPVQLENNSSHLARSEAWHLPRPHLDENSMNGASVVQGYRYRPTALDAVMLQDLGYSVNLTAISAGYDLRHVPHPLQEHYRKAVSAHDAPQQPSSLWVLNEKEWVHSALKGYPLKFMPGRDGTFRNSLRQVEGGLLLERGAFFFVDHNLKANGGGKQINDYSVVLDIKLPRLGVKYSLYNTNSGNANHADAYINPAGQIGEGNYSTKKLAANRWYRIALTVNAEENKRRYFVDGELYFEQGSDGVDGRFGIWPVGGERHPLFVLFGSNDAAEDAPIMTKQAAFLGYSLTPGQVAQLGNPSKHFISF